MLFPLYAECPTTSDNSDSTPTTSTGTDTTSPVVTEVELGVSTYYNSWQFHLKGLHHKGSFCPKQNFRILADT